ncbi:ATP-grasp domain-containing protein [Erwinia sp. HR93]|uniref:ATP-grasp domain-containing protein n=1 Tax=Erwinia sp. HR93 TaxID=3094840 RepID=UPI002ADEF3E8|nr:ATP-grasp domain-containing protein [Erwinia sp. HR93]MEA1064353.1 ATP-grasp domain-containing protein [Erwinia sp. HR93]
MINVLIVPAGTEIGREIWFSLRHEKSIKLFLAGSDYDNHAQYYNDEYYVLPHIDQAGWVDTLNYFVQKYSIEYIFPAHDDVLLEYKRHEHEIGAKIISPDLDCCEITRFKSLTYKKLESVIAVPRVYLSIDEIEKWPVFVKPDRGQGSQGTAIFYDKVGLENHLKCIDGLIISDYLPGDEYTVDCFSQRNGKVIYSQARTRERVRAGISMGSKTIELAGIKQLAQKISDELNLFGAWFFQLKKSTENVLTLLEVAPRIAGTMAVNRIRGINFPLLSLYEHSNIPVKIRYLNKNVRISRALSNKFKIDIKYTSVYIDFDDTLVVKGKLWLPLIKFIFQCINNNIPCYLITRHYGDIIGKLKYWRLSDVFEKVIHLTNGERKSDFIKDENSIFIDDSFQEREEVYNQLGINCFDLSMLDALLED